MNCVLCKKELVTASVGVRQSNGIYGPASYEWREPINALKCPKCGLLYEKSIPKKEEKELELPRDIQVIFPQLKPKDNV